MLEQAQSLCQPKAKRIVSHDSKSRNPVKHIALNSNENSVRQYKLDDLQREKTCCDFAVLNDDLRHVYLIELKGKDIERAVKQLQSAHEMLKTELGSYVFFYRCVYRSGVHGVNSQQMVKLKRNKGKACGKWVFNFKRNLMEENID